jgi:hypothetical protein
MRSASYTEAVGNIHPPSEEKKDGGGIESKRSSVSNSDQYLLTNGHEVISFLISTMLMRWRALSTGILLGHYLTMLWGQR